MQMFRCSLSHLISLILLLFHSEAACGPTRRRLSKMRTFRIWDVNQKVFYVSNNQLVAGYLQAANAKLEEKIEVIPTELNNSFLGIHGGKLWLSCVKSGDKIRLQLEEVDITDVGKNKEQAKRFTFIHSQNGSTTSFESADNPGWFLCTESEGDMPVSLTNKPRDTTKVTQFYFQMEPQ